MNLPKSLMAMIGVIVYENDCKNMAGAEIISVITDELKDFYVLKKIDQYTEDMGSKRDIK